MESLLKHLESYGINTVQNIKNIQLRSVLIGFLLLLITTAPLKAEEWEKIFSLRGNWKFSIGDDTEWAKPDYDDSRWEEIYVPSSWENQGFYGYDGFAWYRKTFKLPKNALTTNELLMSLQMGFIDDVDEVYLNGVLIGVTGAFPPDFKTAYNAYRQYLIPPNLLKYDEENVIAVRVYDSQLEGGILGGDIGIFTRTDYLMPDLSLEGNWKFHEGDNSFYKNPDLREVGWKNIIVPSSWDTQGYKYFDGFAWYRKEFTIPASLAKEHLVLLLGKIDDFDEAYLNGVKIGFTGQISDEGTSLVVGSPEWQYLRGYYIPQGLLKPDQKNVLAVRVYDGYQNGGIYEGPVGFVKQEKYRNFWHAQRQGENFWDTFFTN